MSRLRPHWIRAGALLGCILTWLIFYAAIVLVAEIIATTWSFST